MIRRPRLVERPDEGLEYPLVLLSAPAGFSNSTAFGEWIAARQAKTAASIQVAWLSLDKNDNDKGRLWQYILAALQRLEGLEAGPFQEAARDSPPPHPLSAHRVHQWPGWVRPAGGAVLRHLVERQHLPPV